MSSKATTNLIAPQIQTRWQTVLRNRSGGAIFSSDGAVARSWADIEAEARSFAAALEGGRGAVVLQLANGPVFPGLLLGAWRAGRAVCLVDAGVPPAAVERIAASISAGTVASGHGEAVRLTDRDGGWDGPEAVVLYKLTSGTTSEPTALPFTDAQLLADADQICETMGLVAEDRAYGIVAFTHSYGFSNLVTPLLVRGIPVVTATDALPRALERGLETSAATVLPAVPAMFRALLAADRLPGRLRLCISAGAPLDPGVARAFHEKFGRKIHSFYGASECGGICYDPTEEPIFEAGFVGTPVAGVQIEWAEPAFEEAGGRIRIHSAAVGGLDGSGVFEPADRVVPWRGGFRLVGREADFINVGGKKISPSVVEQVLAKYPGVREVVVFGAPRPPHGEMVCAAVVGLGEADVAGLRAFGATHLAPWERPREIFPVAGIPVNARGKINRRELAARLVSVN